MSPPPRLSLSLFPRVVTVNAQLLSIRQEYELFKASSQRWQADAEIKWRNLKRASESAAREVITCRQTGDAATRELVALKSAFRSFLRTLWDDLLSRPLALVAEAGTRDQNEGTNGNATVRPRASPLTRDGLSENTIMNDIGNAVMAASTSHKVDTYSVDEGASNQLGVAAMTGAVRQDHPRGAIGPGPFEGPFGELSEAEVSDIMQALTIDSSSSSSHLAPNAALGLQQRLEDDPAFTLALEGSIVSDSRPDPSTAGQTRGMATTRPPATPRLEKGDEEFSARVESALGDKDISAALTKMLRSMRSSGGSWRECVDGSSLGDPLVPAPPPLPPPTPITLATSRYPEIDRNKRIDPLN